VDSRHAPPAHRDQHLASLSPRWQWVPRHTAPWVRCAHFRRGLSRIARPWPAPQQTAREAPKAGYTPAPPVPQGNPLSRPNSAPSDCSGFAVAGVDWKEKWVDSQSATAFGTALPAVHETFTAVTIVTGRCGNHCLSHRATVTRPCPAFDSGRNHKQGGLD
jgi:hypothetical protein